MKCFHIYKIKKHVFEAFFKFKIKKKHVFKAFSSLEKQKTRFGSTFQIYKMNKHTFEAFVYLPNEKHVCEVPSYLQNKKTLFKEDFVCHILKIKSMF